MDEQNTTDREEHIKSLYSSLSTSSQQFDKQCLLIASGAFSLSFAFIQDIVPNLDGAVYKPLLIWSWILFAGVVLTGLISHFVSMSMITKAIKHAGLQGTDFNKKIKSWNFLIQSFNILSILGLLIGCIFLICFIGTNLNSSTMSKQQNIPPPTAPVPGSPGTLGAPIPPKVNTPPPPKK